VGVDGAAAAGAAVADGIETVKHRIFEECVVYVAPFFLGLHDGDGFRLTDSSCFIRVVFNNKSGKWFPDNQTDIERSTWIFMGCPAGALQHGNVIGVFQDDVPSPFVWNDLLKVRQIDRLVYCYEFAGLVKRHDFGVVAVGKGDFRLVTGGRVAGINFCFREKVCEKTEERCEDFCQRMEPLGNTDVEICPAAVNVSMDEIPEGMFWIAPGFSDERSR